MKSFSIISFVLLVVFVCAIPVYGKYNNHDVIQSDYNDTDLTQVHFLLWTRSNSGDDEYYELLYDDSLSLSMSPFNDSKRTYFTFHGWGGFGTEGWILNTKTNLLISSDCQVISVDYALLGDVDNYDKAVFNMYNVAGYAASYIDWLVGITALTTQEIHIIGHSLGGQAAGMTGKGVTAGLIDRVTGLDPAGPLFYTKNADGRIDKTDASFVDIIHSNSGSLDDSCVGLFEAVGHVDFYPSGGKHQPGCTVLTDSVTGCSHARSHDYWVESILSDHDDETTKQFWSYECSDYLTYLTGSCFSNPSLAMGYNVKRDFTGSFFLQANDESPFAQGKQSL